MNDLTELIQYLWWMNSVSFLYTCWLLQTWFMLGLIVK